MMDENGSNKYPYKFHLWPDGTKCAHEDLEEYLTYMSNDYLTIMCDGEDIDEVPNWNEVIRRVNKMQKGDFSI